MLNFYEKTKKNCAVLKTRHEILIQEINCFQTCPKFIFTHFTGVSAIIKM